LIFSIARTALIALRRDRAALAMSFILPISFFTIFAVIFGGSGNGMSKINVILVDEDQSRASRDLVAGLERESALTITLRPESKNNSAAPEPEYTAATAEAAVKTGVAPVALVIPKGFGAHPISFGPNQAGSNGPEIQLLNDAGDMIAPQMVGGLLQKAAMTAMPVDMAEQGMQYTEKYIGELTPEQRKTMGANLDKLRELEANGTLHATNAAGSGASSSGSGGGNGGIIPVQSRAVVGENKHNSMVSYYAAAIGVMFLMFTASGAAGALLDEAESGALERVLASHVTMTSLLMGKLLYNAVLAFIQLTVMFVWAQVVFKVDLIGHLGGFAVMGICTSLAVAAFGILLASICQTRAQLGALSTLIILMMSAIGGSMFPRYFMPESIQKAGLFTINAWAIDGFTKVFWRDLPVSELGPQVGVLLAVAVVLFIVSRRIARRWEFA
jgi:ABC-2 type transport system permease protein